MNLADLKTPGVYIDEVPTLPSSIVGVETAIPAFIGYVERMVINNRNIIDDEAPEINAVRLSSMKQYVDIFGGPLVAETKLTVVIDETVRVEKDRTPKEISENVNVYVKAFEAKPKFLMYYQMQMFFANGGGPCYIIPAGKYNETGPEKDALQKKLEEVVVTLDEPTLIVFPDAVGLITIDPVTGAALVSDMYSLYQAALKQCFDLKDRFTIIDLENTKKAADGLRGASGIGNSKNYLRYGAACHPWLKTVLEYTYDPANVTIEHTITVSTTDEAAHTPTPAWNEKKLNEIPNSNVLFNQIAQVIRNQRLELPPSAAMAGIYAFVDNARGVWKAPANVGVMNVNGLTFNYTDEDQKQLNIDLTGGKSINIIRNFTGRGIVVWGARTLDGNDGEWAYVSVRRFFNYVEKSVKLAMQTYVFEPNDANTWVKVRSSIESFLRLQWQAGALQGVKPEQAFYVKLGLDTTMTPQDIIQGKLIVDIGMAVVRPAEFIVLRFMHQLASA